MEFMKRTLRRCLALLLTATMFTACGSNSSSSGQNAQGYKDTKTIILDILKTEDGQKAIVEAQSHIQDKTMKLLSTGDGQQIQTAVKDVLTGSESNKLLQKTMTDPRFAGDFAKALQGNMKQLHKDLLKDPGYQLQLIQLMSNPEYERLVLQTMKSAAYRQQIMSVMQESIQSPLFRMQLMDILKKVVEEEMKAGGQAGQQQGGEGDKKQEGEKGQGSEKGQEGDEQDKSSEDDEESNGDSTDSEKDTKKAKKKEGD